MLPYVFVFFIIAHPFLNCKRIVQKNITFLRLFAPTLAFFAHVYAFLKKIPEDMLRGF